MDFVVVVKPSTRVSLTTVFPENSLGRAFVAQLGMDTARAITVVPTTEEMESTPFEQAAPRPDEGKIEARLSAAMEVQFTARFSALEAP
ncbi:hypothetical protein V5799_013972 [Amblyomma americanum]|uniref:Uncharacterized protein n=1 Tax=Amblyomma americanum TaxID=6943 RepID=A0AAQ4E4E3_AMBAM